MSHDLKGKVIRVGDKVNVPCVVVEQVTSDSSCCLQVRTLHPVPGTEEGQLICLSTKQVKKTTAKG